MRSIDKTGMAMIADSGRLASMDGVARNLALELTNHAAEVGVDLIESVFDKSIVMRQNRIGLLHN